MHESTKGKLHSLFAECTLNDFGEVRDMLDSAIHERMMTANNLDPYEVVDNMRDELFDSGDGVPSYHIPVQGGLVIGCAVWNKRGEDRHECCQYTVKRSRTEKERWVWDSELAEGEQSVSTSNSTTTGFFLTAEPGIIFGRHTMRKERKAGKEYAKHVRNTPQYWRVVSLDERGYPVVKELFDFAAKRLPLPLSQ